MATIVNNIGIVLRKGGDYRRALLMFREALRCAARLRNRDVMLLTLGNIGNVYFQLGHYHDAAMFYDRAISLAEELGRWQGVAINLANRAMVFRVEGNAAEAQPLLSRAISMYRLFPHPEGHVNALVERAKNRFARKQWLAAQRDIETAEPLARSIRHVEALGDILSLRAGLERTKGNVQAAANHESAAARFRRKLKL